MVEELQPDVIIFSVAREYWSQLENLEATPWLNLSETFGDNHRDLDYHKGYYQLRNKKALAILGITTQRGPFGDLNNAEKKLLGKYIKKGYKGRFLYRVIRFFDKVRKK